jgi:hypothetical protein
MIKIISFEFQNDSISLDVKINFNTNVSVEKLNDIVRSLIDQITKKLNNNSEQDLEDEVYFFLYKKQRKSFLSLFSIQILIILHLQLIHHFHQIICHIHHHVYYHHLCKNLME